MSLRQLNHLYKLPKYKKKKHNKKLVSPILVSTTHYHRPTRSFLLGWETNVSSIKRLFRYPSSSQVTWKDLFKNAVASNNTMLNFPQFSSKGTCIIRLPIKGPQHQRTEDVLFTCTNLALLFFHYKLSLYLLVLEIATLSQMSTN